MHTIILNKQYYLCLHAQQHRAKILFLIEDTLKNPVQPLPEVDTALKVCFNFIIRNTHNHNNNSQCHYFARMHAHS